MLKIADETDPVAFKTVDRRNESSTRTLDAVRELAPTIRAATNQIEQGRRLPLDIVREMQRAGVFRGFLFEALGDMWNTLLAGDLPSLTQRARARLAMVHASTACTQAVELIYKASGGSSVYAGNTFERRLRDIQAANQHAVVSLKTWEVAGCVLLGLDPATACYSDANVTRQDTYSRAGLLCREGSESSRQGPDLASRQ